MDARKEYNSLATLDLRTLLSSYTNGKIASFLQMDIDWIENLLNENANPNVQVDDISLMHLLIQLELGSKDDAERNECMNFIETLVKVYGANINIRGKIDSKSVTPLQLFMNLNAGLWDVDLVKTQALRLAQLGAKQNVKDNNGKTLADHLLNTPVAAQDEPKVVFEMRPSLLEESKAELKLMKEDLKLMYEKAKSSSVAKNAATFFNKSRTKLKHYAHELKDNVNEVVREVKLSYQATMNHRRNNH